jgi:glycosyltransferase involved in cell wall biosynthesis
VPSCEKSSLEAAVPDAGYRSSAPDFFFLCIVKVLILHQHFKTPQLGGAIRSYYLAKALVERGIETVVISGHNEPGYGARCVEGINTHYLPVPYDNRFGFYRRVYSFFGFVTRAVRVARHHRDADLCYAISTPLTTGLAAWMIRRYYGIPYIFEVGDLWPDAPIEMGFVKSKVTKRVLYALERLIYRNGLSIVALSVPIREAILKKVSGKEVHVLSNMSDTDFFRPEEKQSALEEAFGVRGKFVVSYIGALGVANGLHFFVDCAAASQRAGLPIHFILCGDGAMADALKEYSDSLRLENFTLVSFRDRDGVREIMNVTDANFICYLPVSILETGSPNKYFDGLAAGKLTVVNFGGWIKDEIERERCGVYVDPSDPGDFARRIKPFLEDAELLKQYQQAGAKLGEGKYSRMKLGERFWRLMLNDE